MSSLDVRTLIGFVNVPSNNFASEMMLKGLGARYRSSGTTRSGAAVVRDTLARIAVRPGVRDGSGLSRLNRATPREVVRLLERMDLPDIGGVFRASLAVAGQTGTVRRRMRATAALGRCRVKTGTLRAVSALAGYCRTLSGRNIGFALMFNRANTFAEKAREDRITAAIARLGADVAAVVPPAPEAPAEAPDGRRRLALSGAALGQQGQQPLLVEHRHAEALGLLELGSGRRAGDDVVGLLRHARGDPSACALDPLGRLLAREVGQRAGQHERA